jgi:hypothetical protein
MAGSTDPKLDSSVAGLLFEIKIAAGAVDLAIEALANKPAAAPLKDELAVLRKLSNQSCEALEQLQQMVAAPADERLNKALEALTFYADDTNWRERSKRPASATIDKGERARQALEEIEGSPEDNEAE